MRTLYLLMIPFVWQTPPAGAVDYACVIPVAYEAAVEAVCDSEIRREAQGREATWTGDDCCTYIFNNAIRDRIGAQVFDVERRDARTKRGEAYNTHDAGFPHTHTRAVCGDSIIDTDYGENCDPPDRTTCSGNCTLLTVE